MAKKSKRIELSEECIMHISIEAIHRKTNFKNYVEHLLEQMRFGKYEFIENPSTSVPIKKAIKPKQKNRK